MAATGRLLFAKDFQGLHCRRKRQPLWKSHKTCLNTLRFLDLQWIQRFSLKEAEGREIEFGKTWLMPPKQQKRSCSYPFPSIPVFSPHAQLSPSEFQRLQPQGLWKWLLGGREQWEHAEDLQISQVLIFPSLAPFQSQTPPQKQENAITACEFESGVAGRQRKKTGILCEAAKKRIGPHTMWDSTENKWPARTNSTNFRWSTPQTTNGINCMG